jgi:hypothetical protein
MDCELAITITLTKKDWDCVIGTLVARQVEARELRDKYNDRVYCSPIFSEVEDACTAALIPIDLAFETIRCDCTARMGSSGLCRVPSCASVAAGLRG